jgi:LemA protein
MRRRTLMLFALCLMLLPALSGCGYNQIQQNEEAVFAAWADVEATYQRRADLIPNLVETVKAYAAHEKETLQAVTDARARIGQVRIGADQLNDPASIAAFQQAQESMSGALSRLLVVAENYPDLKANQNFLMLQEELAGTEGKIAYARQFYNDLVMKFNVKQQVFPSNIIANMFNFKVKEYFEIEEPEARAPVEVKF